MRGEEKGKEGEGVMGTNQGGTVMMLNLTKGEDFCVCVRVRRLAESAVVPVSRL